LSTTVVTKTPHPAFRHFGSRVFRLAGVVTLYGLSKMQIFFQQNIVPPVAWEVGVGVVRLSPLNIFQLKLFEFILSSTLVTELQGTKLSFVQEFCLSLPFNDGIKYSHFTMDGRKFLTSRPF
jgi:hypothetical protein